MTSRNTKALNTSTLPDIGDATFVIADTTNADSFRSLCLNVDVRAWLSVDLNMRLPICSRLSFKIDVGGTDDADISRGSPSTCEV